LNELFDGSVSCVFLLASPFVSGSGFVVRLAKLITGDSNALQIDDRRIRRHLRVSDGRSRHKDYRRDLRLNEQSGRRHAQRAWA
jgi:hypothetical protein